MSPGLGDGDLVLVYVWGKQRVRDVVVAREPNGDVVVKRLLSRVQRTVALGSDNPNGARDSRHYGSVPLSDVIGRVLFSLPLSRLQ